MKKIKILVTGCAGFIGYHLCMKLLENKNFFVIGLDNLNNYYDIQLKKNRLKNIKQKSNNFLFIKADICNEKKIKEIKKQHKFNYIIHLAAQAGVRYSIINPQSYIKSNLNGFFNILDLAKSQKIKHFIFASTSSVYGESKKFPIKETENTDKPISLYAATKKSNEVIAYSYSYLYKLPATGLRFFTAYGPYGRPDMSLFKFVNSILNNKKIVLFNYGKHERDFTYIDDIVLSINKLIKKPSKKKTPFEIFNIGSGQPKKLTTFLKLIEHFAGKKSIITYDKMQLGDIYKNHASTNKIKNYINYHPSTNINKGIKSFVIWYKNYFNK